MAANNEPIETITLPNGQTYPVFDKELTDAEIHAIVAEVFNGGGNN